MNDSPFARFFDDAYVLRRNRLIPQALAVANAQCASEHPTGKESEEWTRVFSTTMDKLAAPLLNGASNGNNEAATSGA